MSVTNRARIEAFIGASGSGKGVSINQLLEDEKPARLLIWDPRDEYGKRAPRYDRFSELTGAFKGARGGPVRARFVPGAGMKLEDAFAYVCKLAFTAGNLTFLAEELSDVTTASRAPAAWRQCCTQGRHQGLHIIGAAQRPALIDKTFLGNCTYVRCFGLRYEDDAKAMAKVLRVPEAEVAELHTSEEGSTVTIRYIERRFSGTQKAEAGVIKLRRRA